MMRSSQAFAAEQSARYLVVWAIVLTGTFYLGPCPILSYFPTTLKDYLVKKFYMLACSHGATEKLWMSYRTRDRLRLFKMPTSSTARGVNTTQMPAGDPRSQPKLPVICTNTRPWPPHIVCASYKTCILTSVTYVLGLQHHWGQSLIIFTSSDKQIRSSLGGAKSIEMDGQNIFCMQLFVLANWRRGTIQ